MPPSATPCTSRLIQAPTLGAVLLWIRALNMWYVVGYEDVRTALLDTTHMTTVSAQSTIFDTFGAHILTSEGTTHDRYRQALRHPFAPGFIRSHLEPAIVLAATALIGEFEKHGQADLRSAFASRLPIQVILLVGEQIPQFGLSSSCVRGDGCHGPGRA
jgi:cytochrome P450